MPPIVRTMPTMIPNIKTAKLLIGFIGHLALATLCLITGEQFGKDAPEIDFIYNIRVNKVVVHYKFGEIGAVEGGNHRLHERGVLEHLYKGDCR